MGRKADTEKKADEREKEETEQRRGMARKTVTGRNK